MPTVAASGLPGYESVSIYGMFAPAKTPAAIVNRLNQEIVRLLATPDVKEMYLARGMEALSSSPQEFSKRMKADMATMGKVIRDAGIRAE